MSDTMLLRNGRVFSRGQCDPLDVLIDQGRIIEIAPAIDPAQAEIVTDLEGLVLAPGFVDIHVHLREPGFSQKETIETGTKAAAAGGFTTVCAMPNLNPVPDSRAHLDVQLSLIRDGAEIEVLPYGAITVGEAGKVLADIEGMAPDCIGFSDDGKGVQNDDMMRKAMLHIKKANSFLSAHCEDESLLVPGGCVHDGSAAHRFGVVGMSSETEWRQIERDLNLVRETGVRYHICHMSAKESVALLRAAKTEGLPISGECTPHQLALCEDDITEDDGRFKMNPPLRSQEDRDAIIAGILDGTIDCIATDHAPHTIEEKSRGLSGSAFGIVGLETAFAVCHTVLVASGLCTLEFLIDKLTTVPARIIGRDVGIAPGMAANLVALDPSATWQVRPEAFYSKGRSTPFAGHTLQGQIAATWYRGHKVYDREESK